MCVWMLRQCRLLGLHMSSRLPVPGPAAAPAVDWLRQRQATRPLGSRVVRLNEVLPALPAQQRNGPCVWQGRSASTPTVQVLSLMPALLVLD